MKALKLCTLLILVVACLLQLTVGQDALQAEGSGVEDDQGVQSSFSMDDYVVCPPDEDVESAGLKKDLGDEDEDEDEDEQSNSNEDVSYDYDEPPSVPAIAFDDLVDSVENVTMIEIHEDELEEASTTVTTDAETDSGDTGDEEAETEESETEESIGTDVDYVEASGDTEDDSASSIHLVRAQRIYSLPDTEPLEARFAAYTEEHPEETVLTSPNYPEPYPNSVNSFEDYTVSGGIGVQITIHSVDLDPKTDFLFIRGGAVSDNDENGPVLTGIIKSPMRFLIPHTTTFSVHFVSQHEPEDSHEHKGFRLTYAPFGTVVSPTTPSTTEMIVPREELQWIRKEVTINRNMMLSVETWPLVKVALANASNAFVEKYQLKYKPCRPDDIRILAQKCPDTWPAYEECVTLEFAVPLRPIVEQIDEEADEREGAGGLSEKFGRGFIKLTTTEAPERQYELSRDNLDRMWNEFGAMALSGVGIEVYKMPENTRILLLWIAISLTIVAAFIFVLYNIWKIDFFKDYMRISKLSREPQDEDRSNLKKKEFDISMFPSPHQVVPSLFSTGDPYSERAAEAQYAYDNSTMNPWAEEQNQPFGHPNAAPTSHQSQQQKQQVFEPLSPLDYSPSIVDFDEPTEPIRSPRRSRNNPFLSSNSNSGAGGGGGDPFNQ